MDEDGQAALAAFCAREHRRLVGSLTLHCGEPHVAAELAQEALARACSDWRRVSRMDAPGAWLHRVAVNLASSHYRRRAAERRAVQRYGSRQGSDRAGDQGGDTGDHAAALAVRRAVAALPLRQRTALVLRYYSDLSVEQTAQAMGCATGTVKSLTSAALSALRAADLADPAVLEEPSRA